MLHRFQTNSQGTQLVSYDDDSCDASELALGSVLFTLWYCILANFGASTSFKVHIGVCNATIVRASCMTVTLNRIACRMRL